MHKRGVFLSDRLIQEKARRLFGDKEASDGSEVSNSEHGYRFSNRWLSGFKKRYKLKCYRSHGEAADADSDAALMAIPQLQTLKVNTASVMFLMRMSLDSFFAELPKLLSLLPLSGAGKKAKGGSRSLCAPAQMVGTFNSLGGWCCESAEVFWRESGSGVRVRLHLVEESMDGEGYIF